MKNPFVRCSSFVAAAFLERLQEQIERHDPVNAVRILCEAHGGLLSLSTHPDKRICRCWTSQNLSLSCRRCFPPALPTFNIRSYGCRFLAAWFSMEHVPCSRPSEICSQGSLCCRSKLESQGLIIGVPLSHLLSLDVLLRKKTFFRFTGSLKAHDSFYSWVCYCLECTPPFCRRVALAKRTTASER